MSSLKIELIVRGDEVQVEKMNKEKILRQKFISARGYKYPSEPKQTWKLKQQHHHQRVLKHLRIRKNPSRFTSTKVRALI